MKKLLWFVPVALFVINCGGGGGNLMPLTVGNTWNYEMSMAIEYVDTLLTDTTITQTMVNEVTEETTLDDSTTEVFEIVSTITTSDTEFVNTSYALDNGDFALSYADKADVVPDTVFAYPLEEGKTWHVNSTVTAVVLGQEEVTVPAGTFSDCWKIAHIVDTDTTFSYVAEGTGEVKSTNVSATATATTTTEVTLQSTNVE